VKRSISMALWAHVATFLPSRIFGVSLTWSGSPISFLRGTTARAAFDLRSGARRTSSLTSRPVFPAMRAWMLRMSTSGPLSSQTSTPWAETHDWGWPAMLMTEIFAESQALRTSAVPWTNSALSEMYCSPHCMTMAPRPMENATRRKVATSGVIPLRVSKSAMGHLFLSI